MKTLIAAAVLAALPLASLAGQGHSSGGAHMAFGSGPMHHPSSGFHPSAPGSHPPGFRPPFHDGRGEFHERFARSGKGRQNFAYGYWGWPGYSDDAYYGDGGGPVGPPPPDENVGAFNQPPAPPLCAEMLEWSPELGRATRHRLCDE
jgi:hypothetical protein